MAGEWAVRQLEDCIETLIDYRGKTPKKTSFGVPLITAKVVKGGRIEPPDEFIADDDYESWMRRGIPNPGDVVITTEAPLGRLRDSVRTCRPCTTPDSFTRKRRSP